MKKVSAKKFPYENVPLFCFKYYKNCSSKNKLPEKKLFRKNFIEKNLQNAKVPFKNLKQKIPPKHKFPQ